MVKLENAIKEANTLTEVPLSLGYGIEAKIQVLVVALQAKEVSVLVGATCRPAALVPRRPRRLSADCLCACAR